MIKKSTVFIVNVDYLIDGENQNNTNASYSFFNEKKLPFNKKVVEI